MKFEANIIIFLQNIFNNIIPFFKIITQLGGAIGIAILFVLLFFRNKKLSLFYLGTSLIGSGGNFLIKSLFNRPRPYVTYPEIINHLEALGTSMPSSHSVVIFIFTFFSIYSIKKYVKNKKLQYLFISLSCILCFIVVMSRMVLGQHYLTDILVGLIIGAILSILSYKFFVKKYVDENVNS